MDEEQRSQTHTQGGVEPVAGLTVSQGDTILLCLFDFFKSVKNVVAIPSMRGTVLLSQPYNVRLIYNTPQYSPNLANRTDFSSGLVILIDHDILLYPQMHPC